MLFTNSKTNIVWWLCLLFTFSCLQGCDNSTTPKKVSLHKRTTTNKTIGKSDQMPMSFKFGFDLRLDPKDDYKIYLPFIQYLTEATGLKFSIVITADYEETIKNLSQWITDLKKVNKELLNEVSELEDNVADFVHNDRPELSESELSDYPNVISIKSYKLRKAA